MPLFSWIKRLRAEAEQSGDGGSLHGGEPSRMLIRELLWHVEDQERLVREVEREQRLAHGELGFHRLHAYPRLRTLIPPSERHQLERLCAQIRPIHAAAVLSRFREVLATDNVLPWELVYVFKQVLNDFLTGEEEDGHLPPPAAHRPMEAWTNRYQMKQGFVTPTVPNCGEPSREEIPTISGHVDRAMRRSALFTAQGGWDLPYYLVPLKSSDAHSNVEAAVTSCQ